MISFLRFHRTVSTRSLNKRAKLSDINSNTPNNIDQMWELKKARPKTQRLKWLKCLIGNLNINFISGKCDQLKCLFLNHVDKLVLTETKLDEMFTTFSFLIDGFCSPFQLDRNQKGGGICKK